MKDNDIIGKDKLYHLGVSFFLSLFFTPIFAIGVGIGKEYGDYKNKCSHWCWWDLCADFIGVILGGSINIYLINLIFF